MSITNIILLVVIIIIIVRTWIRYDPKLDLVQGKQKHLYLWYNKYTWTGDFLERAYVKLF